MAVSGKNVKEVEIKAEAAGKNTQSKTLLYLAIGKSIPAEQP